MKLFRAARCCISRQNPPLGNIFRRATRESRPCHRELVSEENQQREARARVRFCTLARITLLHCNTHKVQNVVGWHFLPSHGQSIGLCAGCDAKHFNYIDKIRNSVQMQKKWKTPSLGYLSYFQNETVANPFLSPPEGYAREVRPTWSGYVFSCVFRISWLLGSTPAQKGDSPSAQLRAVPPALCG